MGTTLSLITFILLLVLTAFSWRQSSLLLKSEKQELHNCLMRVRKKAIAAKKVVDHLDEYLAACQLGITITALGIGMVGESTFEFILHPLFSSIGIPEAWIHPF